MTETSESRTQLRPGLWKTVNERYPGSMITKQDFVPLAPLKKPLSESRLVFVSTAGVQPKGTVPFDVVHPVGDYTFRRVPSSARPEELEIHQLKYPTMGANRDLNVIFPIERLRELVAEGVIGGLTENLYSFIGYNMDPELLERTLARDIADAVEAEGADIALTAPAGTPPLRWKVRKLKLLLRSATHPPCAMRPRTPLEARPPTAHPA